MSLDVSHAFKQKSIRKRMPKRPRIIILIESFLLSPSEIPSSACARDVDSMFLIPSRQAFKGRTKSSKHFVLL